MEGEAATILLVEDHPATRAFLTENLSVDGFRVLGAESVLDALRLIEAEFPDLALIDLGLPDGDGLELMREVRRSDRVTGTIDPGFRCWCSLAGRASSTGCGALTAAATTM